MREQANAAEGVSAAVLGDCVSPSCTYSTTLQRLCQPLHGRVSGGVWRKSVARSVHMLYRPPAWAVDLPDLEAAERLGAHFLELCETEQNHVYRVGLADLRAQGFPLDRGHGQQIALPLGAWVCDGQAPASPKPQPAQLGLALAVASDVDAPFVECWAVAAGKPGFEKLWLRFTADGPCVAWPECLAAMRRGRDTLFILGDSGASDVGAYLPITALAEGGRSDSGWYLRVLFWQMWRIAPDVGAPALDGETLAILQRAAREAGRTLEGGAL